MIAALRLVQQQSIARLEGVDQLRAILGVFDERVAAGSAGAIGAINAAVSDAQDSIDSKVIEAGTAIDAQVADSITPAVAAVEADRAAVAEDRASVQDSITGIPAIVAEKVGVGTDRLATIVAVGLGGQIVLEDGALPPGVSALYIDLTDGTVVLGIDTTTGRLIARLPFFGEGFTQSLSEALPDLAGQLVLPSDDGVLKLALQADGQTLIGTDFNTGLPVIAGLGEAVRGFVTASAPLVPLPPERRPVVTDRRHILINGQSLGVGVGGRPPVSITAYGPTLTFKGGPKATLAGSSAGGLNPGMEDVKLLVEDLANPAGGLHGETPCFGIAKGVIDLGTARGIPPLDNVLFLSAAGHGGYTIDELKKGSAWYKNYLDHVEQGWRAIEAGVTYSLPIIVIIQGEANAAEGTSQASYKAQLAQWIADMQADAVARIGQAVKPHILIVQTCRAAALNPGVALAQAQLAAEDPFVHLVSALYGFPHVDDGVHCIATAYRWLGEAGIAPAIDMLFAGFEPVSLAPQSAVLRGKQMALTFAVPAGRDDSIGVVAQAGLRVTSDTGDVAITSLQFTGRSVLLNLATVPGANPVVRYALDVGLPSLEPGSGAGNLSDTTPGAIRIDGISYPRRRFLPAFSIPATVRS